MIQCPNHVLARSRRTNARQGVVPILSTTSALAIGIGYALFAVAPAQAADECGPAVDGAVTCTAAGNPYADGITYMPTDTFALTTDTDVSAAGTVIVAGSSDVQITHNGTVVTAADGASGIVASGAGVAISIPGTVTTSGAGADAVLVQASGDATVQVGGSVTASGDGSRALNVTGANVGINISGSVATTGNASVDPDTGSQTSPSPAAVLVNASGTVDFVNTGSISTTGSAANAVDITSGGDTTINSTGAINTAFSSNLPASSNGVVINSSGGIQGLIANVTTSFGADAINLTAAAPVTLDVSGINAGHDGLDVTTSAGDIVVAASSIQAGQTAINLNASAGGVMLNADGITTPFNDAVTIHGGAGPVTVNAGTIDTGSDFPSAINATSDTGSAAVVVNKSVTGSVTETAATAASLLVVSGASLNGSTSLTGGGQATFENRGSVGLVDSTHTYIESFSGSAMVVDFTNSGNYIGNFSMAGQINSVANSGRLTLTNTSSFVSGGANSFVNTGVIASIVSPGVQLAGGQSTYRPSAISVAGTFSLRNNGIVDLRNHTAGDVLTLGNVAKSGIPAGVGAFIGGAGSTLYVDVYQSGTVSLSDKLVATGAITGSTRVFLNLVSGAPSLTGGLVFAQGGSGTSSTAFTAAALPSGGGLVRYALAFNPANNSYALVGTPDDSLARALKINEGAQQLWYRSADAASSHFAETRDARFGGYAAGGGRVWGTMYGQDSNRRGGQEISAFGITTNANTAYRQDTFGGQLGFDAVGAAGADGFSVGVTGGYQSSKLNFARSQDSTRFKVANAGLLIGFQQGGLFVNALGQFSYYWARARSREAGFTDRFTGNSYGGQAELGYRIDANRFYVEPVATIAYVRTNLNNLRASSDINVDFGVYQGLRGKAGARIGSRFDLGGGATAIVYAQGNYVHEFKGEHGVMINDIDVAATLRNRALPDYGEGRIGFSAGSAHGVTGFVEGFGTVGHDYRGGGGRAGLRIKL